MDSRQKSESKLRSSKMVEIPEDEVISQTVMGSESYRGPDLGVFEVKFHGEPKTFKLIDENKWNIVPREPDSENGIFTEAHSAMSIISVIGLKGSGKSSLLNKIAGKDVFQTYQNRSSSSKAISVKHVTKGIDIHTTPHRMLLDCQPLNSTSVLEDFLSGASSSQFPQGTLITDPFTSCQMISLQLATFLIATCDYVIILTKWLIDVHFLKLLSSAILMIGESDLRVKLVFFSDDKRIHDKKFKLLIESSLGRDRGYEYFDDEEKLIRYISVYSSEKCDLYRKDPSTFTARNWLTSCQRLWNTTIKDSSLFTDYANQLAVANNL